MEILEKLRARARACPQHIVLFEGEEDRTLEAARLIEGEKLAQLTLLGNVNKIHSRLQALGIELKASQLLDPAATKQASTPMRLVFLIALLILSLPRYPPEMRLLLLRPSRTGTASFWHCKRVA